MEDFRLGVFSTLIEVGNVEGGDSIQLDALVDTGALHTMIPQSVSRQLHIRPQDSEDFELADGTIVKYPVGTARIILQGRDRWCPVIFGPETECLLGATTLEILNLVVDPMAQELREATRRIRPF